MTAKLKLILVLTSASFLVLWVSLSEQITFTGELFMRLGVYVPALAGAVWVLLHIHRAEALEAREKKLLDTLSTLHSLELSDTIRILKAQRHDFINHLQVIYGMLQTGRSELLPEYIRNASQDIYLENRLKGLPVGDFGHMVMAVMVSAMSSSIEFSIDLESEEAWSGFNRDSKEKNMCIRILLHNLIEGLSCDTEAQKKIILSILPGEQEDRIRVNVYPGKSVADEDVVRLPEVFLDLLNSNDTMNIESLWVSGFGGSYFLTRSLEKGLHITLTAKK